MKPQLIDQSTYLYSMLQQTDQHLGKDAYERYEELSGQWKQLKDELNAFNREGMPGRSDN